MQRATQGPFLSQKMPRPARWQQLPGSLAYKLACCSCKSFRIISLFAAPNLPRYEIRVYMTDAYASRKEQWFVFTSLAAKQEASLQCRSVFPVQNSAPIRGFWTNNTCTDYSLNWADPLTILLKCCKKRYLLQRDRPMPHSSSNAGNFLPFRRIFSGGRMHADVVAQGPLRHAWPL